jgi:hypothetical protein
MSVAIPIPLLQNLPDVNVTPAVGVDSCVLRWDNATGKFVMSSGFVVSSSGYIGIGVAAPYEDSDSVGVINIVAASAKVLDLRIDNTKSDSALAGAFVSLHARETGGDPAVGFGIDDVNGASIGHSWHMGVDNSNDDCFTIDQGAIGGNPRLTILRAGNVGFGTAAPLSKVDIIDSNANTTFSASYSQMRLVNTDQTANNYAGFLFGDNAASGFDGGFALQWTSHSAGAEATDFVWYGRSAGAFAERMRLNSSGYLGVGTINPLYPLDVMKADAVTAAQHHVLRISNAGATAGIVLGWIGTGTDVLGCVIRSTGTQPIMLGTTGTPSAITILNAGNVGIGTSAPSAKFDITSPLASDTAGVNQLFRIGYDTNASFGFRVSSADGADRLFLDSKNSTWSTLMAFDRTTGFVGIGAPLPATTLHVAGAATITGGIRPAADGTTALQLQNVAGTSVLNVDTTNQRVGIGTTAPEALLHVGSTVPTIRYTQISTAGVLTTRYDDEYVTTPLVLENKNNATNTNGVDVLVQFAFTGDTTARTGGRLRIAKEREWTSSGSTRDSYFALFLSENGVPAEKLRISSAGNVGINTTAPATALHVAGAATITGGIRPAADSTTALQLQNVAGTSVLNVDTTNSRVGIGTTTPATRLDIDAGALTMAEMTAPTGVANKAMLYTKDSGGGKTQLCCKLGDDVEIVLATQA